MNKTIDVEPEILATEISASIASTKPVSVDIVEMQRQLLSRHANLRLKPKISSEEVVEGFVRCVVIHHLQQRFRLHVDAIPNCVNSSHKAVRRVCASRSRHSHDSISDEAWSVAWLGLQQGHPEVNIWCQVTGVANARISTSWRAVGSSRSNSSTSAFRGCAMPLRALRSYAATP
jgi:hypothetical protein